MADETLTIQQNDARLTVIGKSWSDLNINSGLGIDLPDLDLGDIDLLDLDWELYIDDPDDMPAYIKIEQEPHKTTYTEGDKIKLSGIIVKAYMEDGTPWDGSEYGEGSDGQLAYDHLNYEPKIAISSSTKMTSDLGVSVDVVKNPTEIYSYDHVTFVPYQGVDSHHFHTTKVTEFQLSSENCKAKAFFIAGDDFNAKSLNARYVVAVIASNECDSSTTPWEPFMSYLHEHTSEAGDTSSDRTINVGDNTVFDGKRVYLSNYTSGRHFSFYDLTDDSISSERAGIYKNLSVNRNFPVNYYDSIDENPTYFVRKLAWTAIYGTESGGSGFVTVSWKRPDGVILTDTFGIKVNPKEEETNSQNSGNSGNGGR